MTDQWTGPMWLIVMGALLLSGIAGTPVVVGASLVVIGIVAMGKNIEQWKRTKALQQSMESAVRTATERSASQIVAQSLPPNQKGH